MQDITFTGLGTHWSVMVDAEEFSVAAQTAVLEYVQDFEKRFSRFLSDSEVNHFRLAQAGEHTLSPELAKLLSRADRLRTLTAGAYDPAVGFLLESAGYGMSEAGSPGKPEDFVVPQWSLVGEKLTIHGPVAFDLGGIGKGYCIDQVAAIVRDWGYEYYLVDGGGDMVATTKADGSAWRVAIEYPGKPDMAASVIELVQGGVAVSDSFRRRFGQWHHLVNIKERQSVTAVIGCAAWAPDAWSADCMTSGLFFSAPQEYGALTKEFQASYLLFQKDGTVRVGPDWPGILL